MLALDDEPRSDACAPWVPLHDQAALEAARDEGYAIGRETEAEYWRSMVERLTAQADAWNARYMALVHHVAHCRAMNIAPAAVVDLGPNGPGKPPGGSA